MRGRREKVLTGGADEVGKGCGDCALKGENDVEVERRLGGVR